MIVVVIKFIDDPDPEWLSIAKCTEVNTGDIKVLYYTDISFSFQQCIDRA